jgi:hypothetical protein
MYIQFFYNLSSKYYIYITSFSGILMLAISSNDFLKFEFH